MAVIAVDWDHTLIDGDVWKPGAKEAIMLMREKGHRVIIHSCNNVAWIKKNLAEAGLVVDGIWDQRGKPLADAYIDDKSYRFEGNWDKSVHNMLALVDGLDNRKLGE